MATGRRRWQLRTRVACLLAVVAVIWTSAGRVVVLALDTLDADSQCVHLAPRILTACQKQLLCTPTSSADLHQVVGDAETLDRPVGDLTLPAKCAALALETRATRPSTTKHDNGSVIPHVLALCTSARSLEPANCWLQFPARQRHHQPVTDTPSPSPFVQVCQSAEDTAPAECFKLWQRSSAFLLARDALEAQPTAVRVCRAMRTHTLSEFAVCVKKGERVLDAASSFPLCEFVVPASRRVIADCARALARQRLPAAAIAEACARALPSPVLSTGIDTRQQIIVRPEACMLEAQRSLTQWMNATLFGTLCGQATQGTTGPAECANLLKHDALRRLGSSIETVPSSPTQRRRQLSEFVARMCRGSVNAGDVSACVQILPSKALSLKQVERLCSASASEASNVFPVQCVARSSPMLATMARHRRGQSVKDDDGRSELLMLLCETAPSTAPSDCLASLQFDRRLSIELVVKLCARARSDAPQKCLRRLERHISTSRLTTEDAVTLCSDYDTAGRPNRAADCVERALRELGTHVSTASKLVTDLCVHAGSSMPAECLRQAPSIYSLADKVALCRQATSTDPAQCAARHIKRLSTSTQGSHNHQIDLCHGATSQYPTQCAVEAPYGMAAREIVVLCRQAASSIPARCARAISPSLRLPPEAAARVCSQATSTLPGRCLSQEASLLLRRSEPITDRVVRRCRSAQAELTSLEITHVAYKCERLCVHCPLSLALQAFDQFNDEMSTLSVGYVHVSAEFETAVDAEGAAANGAGNATMAERWPLPSLAPSGRHLALTGRTVVPIVNGSAVFSNLQFSSPGRFVLTFRVLPNGPVKVARIDILEDLEADSLARRCHALFLDQFQCVASYNASTAASSELQYLKLPRPHFFGAINCYSHWAATSGGIAPLQPSQPLLFVIPRAVYAFLMLVDVPREDMSSWERLGVAEDADRRAVRHAYHQRALEWHPDKWRAVQLLPAWRRQLEGVYALVTQAYSELLLSTHGAL